MRCRSRSSSRRAALVRLAVLIVLVGLAVLAIPASAQATSSGDAEVAYAQGLAAFHRGDFEQAAELFEQAASADPDDVSAHYWLALARSALVEGGAAPPPLPARAPLTKFGALPPYELELRASFGNDSNPLLLGDSTAGVAGDGRFFFGPESDSVAQLGARLELRPVRAENWTLALIAAGDQALYSDFGFLDFTRLAGGAQLAWGGDPAGFLAGPLGYLRVPPSNRRSAFLLQARITDDSLDGERLLTTNAAAASLFLRQGARGQTRLSATFFDQDFADDFSGFLEESGTVLVGELEQSVYLGARNRYLRLAVAAGERDAGLAFDGGLVRGRAELALPLAPAWTLSLSGGVERWERDNVESNPLFGSFPVDAAREDTTTRLGAVLSWAVKPRLLLTARGAHIDHDADLGPVAEQFLDLDFQRTVVALGVRWFFFGGGAR